MLRHKGVEFSRLDLPNITHKMIAAAPDFHGDTVPVITIDGERDRRTMKIARALETLQPDPPLFTPEATSRATRRGRTPRCRTVCARWPATRSARTPRRWRAS